jgi:putative component of membrane protein insertase Oxa1/YidC/SpoIIIJ protein YidD
VRQFGAVKGVFLAIKRLLRCHPFGSQGYDPPPLKQWRTSPPPARLKNC